MKYVAKEEKEEKEALEQVKGALFHNIKLMTTHLMN